MNNAALNLRPRMSEKAYSQSHRGIYIFDVPGNVNKHVIAQAVSAQFKVDVTNVNLANRKGKQKRTIYKNGQRVSGSQPNQKVAFVTLKKGQNLPFFQAVEEAEEKEEKVAEKAAAAKSKSEDKEAKSSKPSLLRRRLHKDKEDKK
ncbi:MAG TPA: 50S ribosomal protein L23 [Candidatus Saccharimonadales bacterium]|nr:50S ribosomal protein L23 [Candidatus Saccharimonadales bacterium]